MAYRSFASNAFSLRRAKSRAVILGVFAALGFAVNVDTSGAPSSISNSPDTKCGALRVPDSWSEAEQWTWNHICAGLVADLSEFAGAHPPTTGRVVVTGPVLLSKQFIETILLREPFRSLIPRQGVRIAHATFSDAIDLSAGQFTWDVWLDDSTFSHGVHLNALDTSADLTFDGTKVAGVVDLTDAHIRRSLRLRGGSFGEVTLDGAQVDEDLDLSGDVSVIEGQHRKHVTRVREGLTMASIHVGHDLLLEDAIVRELDLSDGARIGGSIVGARLEVTKELNMDSLEVGDHLILDHCKLGDVVLAGAVINGNIHMEDASIGRTADMDNLQAKRHLILAGATVNSLHAFSAQVGADLVMSGMTALDPLIMPNISIGGQVVARGAHFSDVDLTSANVGSDVSFYPDTVDRHTVRTVFLGKLTMVRIRVGQDVVLQGAKLTSVDLADSVVSGNVLGDVYAPSEKDGGDSVNTEASGDFSMNEAKVLRQISFQSAALHKLSLVGVSAGGDVILDNATIAGALIMDRVTVGGSLFFHDGKNVGDPQADQAEVTAVLTFSSVAGVVDLSNTEFEALDLTNLRVGQNLVLGRSANNGSTEWAPRAFINLRNVSTLSFQDMCTEQSSERCLDWWPAKLDLNGFTYTYLGSFQAPTGRDMLLRSAHWWADWLERQTIYSPEPYAQVAATLKTLGRPDAAEAVQYAGRLRELREEWRSLCTELVALNASALGSLLHLLWLVLLWAAVGFGIGYRVLTHTLFWVLVWVVLGVLVLRHYGENNKNGLPNYPIAYSFDMLLPVIKLREAHYAIDLQSRARVYFYYQKIMGYVLASFLIAGLTGFIAK